MTWLYWCRKENSWWVDVPFSYLSNWHGNQSWNGRGNSQSNIRRTSVHTLWLNRLRKAGPLCDYEMTRLGSPWPWGCSSASFLLPMRVSGGNPPTQSPLSPFHHIILRVETNKTLNHGICLELKPPRLRHLSICGKGILWKRTVAKLWIYRSPLYPRLIEKWLIDHPACPRKWLLNYSWWISRVKRRQWKVSPALTQTSWKRKRRQEKTQGRCTWDELPVVPSQWVSNAEQRQLPAKALLKPGQSPRWTI